MRSEREIAMSTYFSSYCGQSMHYFLRDDENIIQAYHPGDDSLCESAEFNFADMLNDEVERVFRCPQCDKIPADQDHIRKCSGYRTPLTKAEILDAYSDPTEAAKLRRLLTSIR